MLERISQAAEQITTKASRREFLGRFGASAVMAAAAIGGVLAMPAIACAGRRPPAMCSAGSSASCSGLNVGDACYEEFTGVCKASRKDGGACYCDFRGRGRGRG